MFVASPADQRQQRHRRVRHASLTRQSANHGWHAARTESVRGCSDLVQVQSRISGSGAMTSVFLKLRSLRPHIEDTHQVEELAPARNAAALASARRASHSRPPLSSAAAMTAGGKPYTIAQVERPSAALAGKLLISIGQRYLRFSERMMTGSVAWLCSGSAPVWSRSDRRTASTAALAVSGPGNRGSLAVINPSDMVRTGLRTSIAYRRRVFVNTPRALGFMWRQLRTKVRTAHLPRS